VSEKLAVQFWRRILLPDRMPKFIHQFCPGFNAGQLYCWIPRQDGCSVEARACIQVFSQTVCLIKALAVPASAGDNEGNAQRRLTVLSSIGHKVGL
jgi:hypothetical protein